MTMQKGKGRSPQDNENGWKSDEANERKLTASIGVLITERQLN